MDPRQTLPQAPVPVQGPQGTTIAHTQGPQAATVNFNTAQQYSPQAVQAQNQLMSQLAQQAQGQGPSVAQAQLQQGQQANLAATMAQLASQRGQPSALAQRTAANNLTQINAQTNQQAAMARLQEQLQAQGLLGQVSGQAQSLGLQQRGQDIGLATTNAANQQASNLAGYQGDLQTNLAQAGINANNASQLFAAQQQGQQFNAQQQAVYNNLIAQYAQMGMTAQQANQAAANAVAQMGMNSQVYNSNIASANQAQNVAIIGGLLGGASQMAGGYATKSNGGDASKLTGLAALGAFGSDERIKKNIKDGDDKLDKFLSAIGSKSYEYKDPKFGAGTYVSPMAQELEKTELGKHMVTDTPEGKMVSYGRIVGTVLSAQAMLHRRLKELEGKAS
jgi:hypothetical protein